MYRIGKTFKFDAAHQLLNLPEGHQCGRLHGHTYKVTLTLRSNTTAPLPGWVFDYGDMKPFKDYIDQNLDHRCLNDVPEINFQPTAELLAAFLYDKAYMVLDLPPTVYLDSVRVCETENTFAEYSHP
jgi:6-pyruvoyltetrahydropterin/6-carboxytetrahydropterin synthase